MQSSEQVLKGVRSIPSDRPKRREGDGDVYFAATGAAGDAAATNERNMNS